MHSFLYLKVITGNDPLDSKDFNPVDYINTLFPTEQVNKSFESYKIIIFANFAIFLASLSEL